MILMILDFLWEKDAFRSLGYGSVLLSREQVCAAQVPWWLGVAQIHKDICGIVVASVFLSSRDLKQQFYFRVIKKVM